MMDDLRTRIISALLSEDDVALMADAVIAELDLHYQYENGRVMYDTKPAACKPNGNWKVRIVSPHTIYKEDDATL